MAAERGRGSATSRVVAPDDPAFRIHGYPFYWINRVAGLYARRLDEALKPTRADQAHWRVLMILSEHDPASMGLLADMAVMKLPTVVKLVRRMAREGLVRIAPRASDQRVMDVGIRPAGRRALRSIRRAAAAVFAGAVQDLSPRELAVLVGTLRTLAGSLAAPAAGTGPRARSARRRRP